MNDINQENICKNNYLENNDKVIFEHVEISHDGYDQYGPESYLYDYLLVIRRDNKILYEIFHREYWYQGNDDEEYYIFPCCYQDIGIRTPYIPFVKNVIRILKDYENYLTKDIKKLTKENKCSSFSWFQRELSHKEMIKYLSECEVLYEWWNDKKLIDILKEKKKLDLSIIYNRLLHNNIMYN